MLDTWFPVPEMGARGPSGTSGLLAAEVSADLAERDENRGTESVLARTVTAALDDKPAETYDAYPRLHLL